VRTYVILATLVLWVDNCAPGQECRPACGEGQSCCVIQYSDDSHSGPFCKNGSCYTSATGELLKKVKEVDVGVLRKQARSSHHYENLKHAQERFSTTVDCSNKGFILNSIEFIDGAHLWAVGDGGRILATTDGGKTWCAQNSGVWDDLEGVKFTDARHGWAVGFENGTILRTEDGGVTWERIQATMTSGLDSVSFSDPQHGWIVGQNGVILATTDGGIHWQRQQINSSLFNSAWLLSVNFIDSDHGWATGRALLATSDGGKTWVDTQANNTNTDNRAMLLFNFLNSVFFVDIHHGWIAADGGLIVASTDGGSSWNAESVPIGDNLNAIFFTDLKHGWAAGNIGTIVATKDGGESWTVQNSRHGPPYGVYQGLTSNLRSVICSDTQNCWAAGSGETILATSDGGTSWHIQH